MAVSNNKYIVFILGAVLCQAAAFLIIKLASESIQQLAVESIVLFAIALICLCLQAILWQQALKHFELFWAYLWNTLLYPILVLFGAVFFHETIDTKTVMGLVLIISGVLIINLEKHD